MSTIYGAVVAIRLWLYQSNIVKKRKVPCFVISIGNIVAGGSGKTPMAIYVAEMVNSMGLNPVIVSRGYGGKIQRDSNKLSGCVVAGDGEQVLSSPEIVGDEPFMMASRRSFPVVVGKDRFKAAMMSLDLFNSKGIDVIILDDGFQHLRLKRDLDIVLMDCNRPLGNGCLLPAGRLRESPGKAIERADMIIFTRYSGDESYQKVVNKYKTNKYKNVGNARYNNTGNAGKIADKIFFTTSHRPFLYSFSGTNSDMVFTLEYLRGRKACLFSGIADNLSFRKTVQNLAISIKAHLEFNDHHMYKSEEISMILETYHKSGADLMITTEKDAARLGMDNFDRFKFDDGKTIDFAVIGIEIDFLDKQEEFKTFIKTKLQNKPLQHVKHNI
ncbi:MAG: tetraacyldisaccharide 4'-kinase [Desulfamplus sp.]|nr:tetraacyldisaccharide 4'-kinase [Desulfamplus sp.]